MVHDSGARAVRLVHRAQVPLVASYASVKPVSRSPNYVKLVAAILTPCKYTSIQSASADRSSGVLIFGLLKPSPYDAQPTLALAERSLPIRSFRQALRPIHGRAADQRKGAEHWFKRGALASWRVVKNSVLPLFEAQSRSSATSPAYACARFFLSAVIMSRHPTSQDRSVPD